ncbi:MAG: TRAP transporter substrate-binding protein DctP [Geminicoccaceae bacterium]
MFIALRSMQRRGAPAIVGTVLAFTLGVSAAQAQTYQMVIAHLLPEDLTDNEIAPAMAHFKTLVEARTGGDLEVQVFGAGALGSEVDTGKQAQGGTTVQSSIMSSGAMSSFYPKYQIITTPFLFPNYRVAWAYFDGPWHAGLMRGAIDEAGLRYLGTFDDGGGFVAFTNNVRPIKTLEDIQGLRIRVEENPAHVATMKALGASATPLPWGEVLTALGTGLADGQFNAPGVSASFKLWDVNDYTTWSGHVFNSQSWMVGESWFQSLPDEYKAIIVDSAQEAVQMAHGIAALAAVRGWQESCQNFDECIILADDEKQKMADVARPAWKEWITGDFGIEAGLVDELWAEVDRISQELADRDRKLFLD